jgi:hypothetical protein
MAKRIEIDEKFYRLRRGDLVEIPQQWLNVVPTKGTINNRPSKLTNKLARSTRWRYNRPGASGPLYVKYIEAKLFDPRIDYKNF